MKIRILILIITTLSMVSCRSKSNQIVFDEAANQEILYGLATTKVFENEIFSRWYLPRYNEYSIDTDCIDSLKLQINEIHVKIILGTWCGDSRREVPRFIKILNEVNFPFKNVSIIGVNRAKICPEAGVDKGYVDYVPTFIFLRNGMEIGRIIEKPIISLEKDFLIIASKNV
jgi:thiol-disulfide isomerase/thioredoxin